MVSVTIPDPKTPRERGARLVARKLARGWLLVGLAGAALCGGLALDLMLRARRAGDWTDIEVAALFAVIALAGGGWALHRLMVRSRFAPAELTLSAHPLRLGERFRVEYHQRVKRRTRVPRATLRLVCWETARAGSGRSRRVFVHDAHSEERELLRQRKAGAEELLFSHTEFEVPRDGMHTLRARENEIEWSLELRVSVPGWPDYRACFPLEVLPVLEPER